VNEEDSEHDRATKGGEEGRETQRCVCVCVCARACVEQQGWDADMIFLALFAVLEMAQRLEREKNYSLRV